MAAVALLCLVTPYNNHYVSANTYLSSNHLPLGPLLLITALILLFNQGIARFSSRWRIRRDELVIIWCMTTVAVGIPSKAFAEYLIPQLAAPFHLATPENQWTETFGSLISEWVAPRDSRVVADFYGGGPLGVAPWVKPWPRRAILWPRASTRSF